MIFADNCYLFVENKTQMLKMIGDATENLKKRGLDSKEDEMETIPWGRDGNIGDFKVVEGGRNT